VVTRARTWSWRSPSSAGRAAREAAPLTDFDRSRSQAEAPRHEIARNAAERGRCWPPGPDDWRARPPPTRWCAPPAGVVEQRLSRSATTSHEARRWRR
jgi:hypothetical protein